MRINCVRFYTHSLIVVVVVVVDEEDDVDVVAAAAACVSIAPVSDLV